MPNINKFLTKHLYFVQNLTFKSFITFPRAKKEGKIYRLCLREKKIFQRNSFDHKIIFRSLTIYFIFTKYDESSSCRQSLSFLLFQHIIFPSFSYIYPQFCGEKNVCVEKIFMAWMGIRKNYNQIKYDHKQKNRWLMFS